MNIQSILLLIVSVMLVIVCSWNLSIFVRLKGVFHRYKTDEVFNYACNISKEYVKYGEIVSISMLVISFILLIGSSINLYYRYKK